MKTKTSIFYGLVGKECLDTNLFNYMKKRIIKNNDLNMTKFMIVVKSRGIINII